jgi:alkyl hydroperoxide reductase subunit AhpF
MNSSERKKIEKFNSELTSDIGVDLVLTEDKRSEELSRFCEELAKTAPKIAVNKKKDEDTQLPYIKIDKRVIYHAVPLGTELEPFLDALCLLENSSAGITDTIQKQADSINLPASLKVFVSQHCPFCPATVKKLLPLAFANDLVKLVIIDGTLFHETAQQDSVSSAPTVLLDDDFRWTGQTDVLEIIKILSDRDPEKLGVSSLESLVGEGNASKVAEMMLKKKAIFPAFIDMLVNEKWSVRLGAMVAMENIIEHNIDLAGKVVDPLWERFHDLNDQVKGDVIYIIGASGTQKIVSELQSIFGGPYSIEIKEAAMEAIQNIEERS